MDPELGEQILTSKLAPKSEVMFGTYFSHEWIFKRYWSNDRLFANANGVQAEVFEGCRFKVKPTDRLIVEISTGN